MSQQGRIWNRIFGLLDYQIILFQKRLWKWRAICFLCLFLRATPLWLIASGGGGGVCICSSPFAPCLASDAEHLSQPQAPAVDDAFPPKTVRKSWKLVGPKNSFTIHLFMQHRFFEHLLWAEPWVCIRDTGVNQTRHNIQVTNHFPSEFQRHCSIAF